MAKTYDKWRDVEVRALLAYYANDEVQRRFDSTRRNENIYLDMSTYLKELGIHHPAKQCREKLKKLKQDYRRLKDHNNRGGADMKTNKWYRQMDSILGHRATYSSLAGENGSASKPNVGDDMPSHPEVLKKEQPDSNSRSSSPYSQEAVGEKAPCTIASPPNYLPEESQLTPPCCSTQRSHKAPRSSLRLCVPPLRLLSAFMWQVVEQRKVRHYSRLEEFVSAVLELLPGLLCAKESAELLLGLRARFILELCHNTPSVNFQLLQPHLDRLRRLAEMASTERSGDEMVGAAVKDFISLIQTILKSPQERKHFFKDMYPLHYGPRYDSALKSLLWKLLCRLEKLLPVPSFHQTASWFDEDPVHMEESLQMEPKEVQNMLHCLKNLGLLDPGPLISPIVPNTILSTMSVPITPLLGPHEHSEFKKCSSKPNNAETSVEEDDRNKDKDEWMMDDEDGFGNVLEEGIQQCLNEDSQLDTDEGTQSNIDEKHLNDQEVETRTKMNGEEIAEGNTGGQESTDNSRSEMRASTSTGSDPGLLQPCGSVLEMASQTINTTVSTANEPLEQSVKAFLLRHDAVTHENEKNHLCTLCGIGFQMESDLKKHESIHTQPYLCSYCGKTFRCRHTLMCHTRVHTGERPYSCSVCGRRFIQSSSLAAHKRLHTGEKPYLCSVCGKGFAVSGGLIVHTRLHTGERPYKCEFCGKGYRMACHLAHHRRFHTDEKPYSCKVCDKPFRSLTVLTRHVRTHTGEKPYECLLCGRRFSTATTLKIHQRVHM